MGQVWARIMMLTLAELCLSNDWTFHRDAQVSSFGFIEIDLERRLVFAIGSDRLEAALAADGVAAVLVDPSLAKAAMQGGRGVAVTRDPRRAFLEAHNKLAREKSLYGLPAPTRIDPSATVHPRAHVDETGVVIGRNCRIDAGAMILEGTELGADVRVMAGAVLGSDGFQSMMFAGTRLDFIHAGRLRIGDRCVVMANAVVARAVFNQATTIGPDCRIGNGAFVSHNCQIAQHTMIGHGAIIAGNCRIGANVTVGPGAVCSDRITVGDDARITLGAVVTRSIERGTKVSGNFAVPHDQFKRVHRASYRPEPGTSLPPSAGRTASYSKSR
jgi:UDP-3-O-[3-hydroxymyristoyl] glucosamine N-acyltransferase